MLATVHLEGEVAPRPNTARAAKFRRHQRPARGLLGPGGAAVRDL